MKDERHYPPRIPIIISQNANHPIQMNILEIRDVGQNKQCIMDALTIPDDRWDPEMSQASWSMISLLLEMDLLTHEDTVRLLTCRNICTSLHIWGGGEIFMDMHLLERQDMEENKSHLFRVLTARDSRYDPEFSRYTWDTISFMMEYHFMTVQDILTLLVSTNDSVSFAVWSHAGFLASHGFVSNHDLEKNKSWFLGLLADHTYAWEPHYPRDVEEDDLWCSLSYMAENKILTRQNFVAMLERNHDDLTAVLWMCSKPLVRFGLLDPDDLRNTKDSFFRVTRRSLEGATVFDMAHTDRDIELPLWRVIRAAIKWGVLTPGDSEFFSYLLSCRNNELFLSIWRDGSDLIRRGLLSREDFVSHKDRFNTLLLETNIWARCSTEGNKYLLKFLLDIGLCNQESLQLLAVTDHDSLPIAARGLISDLALDRTIMTLIKELEDPNPEVSSGAAQDLVKIENEEITDRVIPLLRYKDARVRYHAADIIANRRTQESTINALILALGDEEAGVRLRVCPALMGHSPDRLREAYTMVREIHYRAFSELASIPEVDEIIMKVLKRDSTFTQEIATLIVRKSRVWRTQDTFIQALNALEPCAVHDAASAVVRFEADRLIGDLVPLLETVDPDVRATVIQAMGRFRSAHAASAVLPGLNDHDPTVRFSASRALGVCRSDIAVDPLMRALKDENASVRYSAAEALGIIRSDRAVRALILALTDDSEIVRFFAARALGRIRSDKAVPALTAAAQDSNIVVRVAAEEALWQIGEDVAETAESSDVKEIG